MSGGEASSGGGSATGLIGKAFRALTALARAFTPGRALAQAEADARRAEQRLREALDVLPEGIVFLDAEGRYILWNKSYAEIYARSADLFREGAKLADTLRIGVMRGDYPQAVGREEEWLAERLALLDSPGERHEQLLASGRWMMIEERRTSDGGAIGIRIDITDMKAQAAALSEALARAEAASKAKSEFLANVSHELRTPLNGVIGLAEVLSRSKLGVAQQGLVRDILASASTLSDLLGDLLDFNALEAGQVEVNRRRFSLPAVAAEVADAYRAQVAEKGLSFRLTIAEGVDGEVVGDDRRLRQILGNLISNAIKFTNQGEISLRVATLFSSEGDRYRIEVADTGIGFDDTDAERLFAHFETGDASATRSHGGIGLGLPICRQLAELMGGSISARSRPGAGAAFTVILPLPRAPADEALAQEGALRILLADDNATNRKVVEMILEAVGAEVVSAENGAEAVAAVAEGGFDAVLMDLQMPVMDGLTAIGEIRAAEAASGAPRLPIIVLSANTSADDVAASTAAGADGHLGKPIRPEALINALAQAVTP